MIYEMRSYRAMPGRMPDLLKRFDTITLKLFDKHGIKQAGFWTTEVGESNHNLMYLVRLRVDGRAREEVGGVLDRSGMAREARRDREERPAGDDVLEPVPQADELFVSEMMSFSVVIPGEVEGRDPGPICPRMPTRYVRCFDRPGRPCGYAAAFVPSSD